MRRHRQKAGILLLVSLLTARTLAAQPLVVNLSQPVDGAFFPCQDLSALRGEIRLPDGLLASDIADVSVEVRSPRGPISYSFVLTPYTLEHPTDPRVLTFAVDHLYLFQGENRITVSAEERGNPGSSGEATVVVVSTPAPAALNIYALGMEVTQAVQGDHAWDGVAARDPVVKRSAAPLDAIPYQLPGARDGVPLVAHKSTVVRVYGAIEGTAVPVSGVPARLTGRVGGTVLPGSPLLAELTLDPADNVSRLDGSLDTVRTLENKRGDLARSWNFVLPDSWTVATVTPDLEVELNPPDVAGFSECFGCSDHANNLTVSGLEFSKTASISIRSVYIKDDAGGASADVETFCGAFLNTYPVRDGCGTGPINENDLDFGINLLSLVAQVQRDSGGAPILDGGFWQDQMCKRMLADYLHTLPFFTPPAAYVALGSNGIGGALGNGISPTACAATDFPGFFEEYRYGVAAQEVGHGDFTSSSFGPWHACGPGELASYPKYANAHGDEYYQGSIGQFGIDTSNLPALTLKDPARVVDFMGYTYCDRWTADLVGVSQLLARALAEVRIGTSAALPASADLFARGVTGTIEAAGIVFTLEALTPATTARRAEGRIALSGSPAAGDLFVQVDDRPPLAISISGGESLEAVRTVIVRGLNDQAGVDIQDREPFAAFPWVSPFTYNTIFPQVRDALIPRDRLTRPGGAEDSLVARSGEQELLVTAGRIGPGDAAAFDPFYRILGPGSFFSRGGAGAYELVLEDAEGESLFVHRFELEPAHPEHPQVRRFNEILPFALETARIVLKHGANVLAAREVSANAPVVTVFEPGGGGPFLTAGEPLAFRWQASDADGDTLFFLVQYSRDAGETWRTIAADLTVDELVLDAASLPGSDTALVRVLASDGVNTVQDQADSTFIVPRKNPVLWISGLRDHAVIGTHSVVNLQANFADPDEEPIDERELAWSSDTVGLLGTGSRLVLVGAELPPGIHEISLTAPGEAGALITASVTILRAPLGRELR